MSTCDPIQQEQLSSYPSLPADGGMVYNKIKHNINMMLLEALLQEVEGNRFAVVSLSDIGRRASMNKNYIHFDEEFIPAFLEEFVKENWIQQEIVIMQDRKQPIYTLNKDQQFALEVIVKYNHSIRIPKLNQSKINSEGLVSDIFSLYNLGLRAETISSEVNLDKQKVKKIVRQQGLFFTKGRAATYAKTITQLLKEDNLTDIFRRFEFSSPSLLYEYFVKQKIQIPAKLTPYRFDNAIDKLIEQGASLEEIGTSQHKTRQWAKNYIVGGGWYSLWEKKRIEQTQKSKKQTQFDLIYLLSEHVLTLATAESWPMQKAMEYYLNANNRCDLKPLCAFVDLFQLYEQAVGCGEKLSILEFERKTDFSAHTIRSIFQKVNLPKLVEFVQSPKQKLDVLKRGVKMGLSATDLSYFVAVPSNNVYAALTRFGYSSKPTLFIEVSYRNDARQKKERKINFCLASEVYEAYDAGFCVEDIKTLTRRGGGGKYGCSVELIETIISSRSDIEPTLINALQQLYNRPNLNKPYKINW